MKITSIETLQFGAIPNILIVRLETDEGLVGLGLPEPGQPAGR